MQLLIYDPSHSVDNTVSGANTRLDSIPYSLLSVKLVKSLHTNRRQFKEVWIGGGGNEGSECLEMTVRWMGWAVDKMENGVTLEEIRRPEENWVKLEWFK